MGVTLQWQGLDRLVRQARELGRPVPKAELEGDLMYAVEPVVEKARDLAARSSGAPTHGDLHAADTIRVEPEESSSYGGPGAAAVAVGPTAKGWWLRFFEEGTYKLSAQPWLRPAIDQSVSAFVARFAERQRARIARIMGAA